MSEITKTYGDVIVGDEVWICEGPFARRKQRDTPIASIVVGVTERNIILNSGRKFSRISGEERGKAANLWLKRPDITFREVLGRG
jgi:hypothetical protein